MGLLLAAPASRSEGRPHSCISRDEKPRGPVTALPESCPLWVSTAAGLHGVHTQEHSRAGQAAGHSREGPGSWASCLVDGSVLTGALLPLNSCFQMHPLPKCQKELRKQSRSHPQGCVPSLGSWLSHVPSCPWFPSLLHPCPGAPARDPLLCSGHYFLSQALGSWPLAGGGVPVHPSPSWPSSSVCLGALWLPRSPSCYPLGPSRLPLLHHGSESTQGLCWLGSEGHSRPVAEWVTGRVPALL